MFGKDPKAGREEWEPPMRKRGSLHMCSDWNYWHREPGAGYQEVGYPVGLAGGACLGFSVGSSLEVGAKTRETVSY